MTVLGLTLALALAAAPSGWLEFPARDSQPAFRLRVTAQGSRVSIELDGAKGVDRQAVGLHLWLADPELVRRRVADLSAAREGRARLEALIADPDHQDADCAGRLREFRQEVDAQVRALSNVDPFAQVVLRFPEGVGASTALALGAFGEALELGGRLEASQGVLSALSLGARLEPLASARPGPISGPVLARLTPPLTLPVSAEHSLDLLALGKAPVRLVPDAGVYGLFSRGVRSTLGCYGVDGDVQVPGDLVRAEVAAAGDAGLELRFHQGRLALQSDGRRVALELPLSTPQASQLEVLALDRLDGGVVLLARALGPSRPGNGMGQCGAGEEVDLIWLRLGPRLEVLGRRIVPFASCWHDLVPDEVDGGWVISDFSKNTRTHLGWDPARPAAGLSVKTSPLPKP